MPHKPGLMPGMYVDVAAGHRRAAGRAAAAQAGAAVYDHDQAFVYRLKPDSTVERLLVQPTLEDAAHVESARAWRPATASWWRGRRA